MQFDLPLDVIDSFVGIATAVITLIIGIIVYVQTQKIAESDSRPLLGIFCGCHSDQVYVRVGNYGNGPAVIKDVTIFDNEGNSYDSSLAHYIFDKNNNLKTYQDFVPVIALKGRPVATDSDLFLIKYSGTEEEVGEVRDLLSNLTITISYENSLETKVKKCTCVCANYFAHTSNSEGPILNLEKRSKV